MLAVVYFRPGFDLSVALHNTLEEAHLDWARGVFDLEICQYVRLPETKEGAR
jgi:hypothetical protein